MSEERNVNTSSGGDSSLTEEQIRRSMSREEKKARAVRILERGIVADRTTVENLPPHLHGEWVEQDPLAIERKRALGFWIDRDYAPKRALHSDGTDSSIVGDTVYMVCLKEDKDIIDEARHEQYIRMHGTSAQKRELGLKVDSTKEEKEFKTQADQAGVPIIEESKMSQVRKDELVAALQGTGEQIETK